MRKQSQRATHLLTITANAVDEIAIQVRGAKSDREVYKNPGSVLFKLACYYESVLCPRGGSDSVERRPDSARGSIRDQCGAITQMG